MAGKFTALLSILLLVGAVLLARYSDDPSLDEARLYLAEVIAPPKRDLSESAAAAALSATADNTTTPEATVENVCGPLQYTTELLSMDPLIIYINNFLSPEEIDGLLKLGENLFHESTVSDDLKERYQHPSRTSSTAYLPANNPYSQCALAKAHSFLGFYDFDEIEAPQLTKYASSQEYRGHFDWPPEPWREPARGNLRFDRFATFFVYLEANCTGGSTHFPHVFIDDAPHLDQLNATKFEVVIEPDGPIEDGKRKEKSLAAKAIPGNAVFWVNMEGRGRGNPKTLHAGMPVIEGTKVGLNLWSRRYLADDEDIGDGSSAQAQTASAV
ncbi:hypothetical protein F5884DRAFT_265988 [Xylogone sp. PMI_703]|nr:hypothetical protein F5884DRAFT_265988 [Xylogone sp. PMI_703]